MTHKLVYLTGAPATGKSTLTENLGKLFPKTHIFTYNKELLALVKTRLSSIATQDDLRRESSNIITRDDVEEIDRQLLDLVNSTREKQHIVVDSHPVTIENYGFRVTPFSKRQISQLAPDVIICLYASSEIIADRIKANAAGRPLPSLSDLDLHAQIQCQVASMYAFETGSHLYYLNSGISQELLLDNFLRATNIGQ